MSATFPTKCLVLTFAFYGCVRQAQDMDDAGVPADSGSDADVRTDAGSQGLDGGARDGGSAVADVPEGFLPSSLCWPLVDSLPDLGAPRIIRNPLDGGPVFLRGFAVSPNGHYVAADPWGAYNTPWLLMQRDRLVASITEPWSTPLRTFDDGRVVTVSGYVYEGDGGLLTKVNLDLSDSSWSEAAGLTNRSAPWGKIGGAEHFDRSKSRIFEPPHDAGVNRDTFPISAEYSGYYAMETRTPTGWQPYLQSVDGGIVRLASLSPGEAGPPARIFSFNGVFLMGRYTRSNGARTYVVWCKPTVVRTVPASSELLLKFVSERGHMLFVLDTWGDEPERIVLMRGQTTFDVLQALRRHGLRPFYNGGSIKGGVLADGSLLIGAYAGEDEVVAYFPALPEP